MLSIGQNEVTLLFTTVTDSEDQQTGYNAQYVTLVGENN